MSNVIHVVYTAGCSTCVFYRPKKKHSPTFGICKCAHVCASQIPLPGIKPTLLQEGEKK